MSSSVTHPTGRISNSDWFVKSSIIVVCENLFEFNQNWCLKNDWFFSFIVITKLFMKQSEINILPSGCRIDLFIWAQVDCYVSEPTDTVYAVAGSGDLSITSNVVFKFTNKLMDRLQSYDVTTGYPFLINQKWRCIVKRSHCWYVNDIMGAFCVHRFQPINAA